MSRVLLWYSSGAASAVASALTVPKVPDALLLKCDTNAEHPDNERFDAEVERWIGKPLRHLSNSEYIDTWHYWEERRYLAGVHGAGCTGALKKAPRLAFQKPGDIHVFGYTADRNDMARADRLREANPTLQFHFPLIDQGLDKRACLALVEGAGIELPVMYRLGFSNNNCIPCVKATSPNYWSAIRLHFPAEFERMAKLSRELGARLCELHKVRIFIDEIPADWPTLNPVVPACDFLCHLAEQELPHD